jgi:hypothetical protein
MRGSAPPALRRLPHRVIDQRLAERPDRAGDLTEAALKRDELELLPLPEKSVYDDNEMPNAALLELDLLGLIVADPAKAP